MSLADMISMINANRQKVGQSPIVLNSRTSSSGTGTTLEVLTAEGVVLGKSIHGGAMNWFLKGMLCAFQSAPAPAVGNWDREFTQYRRLIDLG
jgi:hypothetical protein